MTNQIIWIGITVGVFFAGLGVGYAMFYSAQPNFMHMTPQQMQQMMNNPQFMNQWHQHMMQNPQLMNQWTNTMIQNPQAGQWMMGSMMNDPQFSQQMYGMMTQHNQFMQGMMNYPQFQNQWMDPMMRNWNTTSGYHMGSMSPGMMMGTPITENTKILSTITNIKKLLDDASFAYNSGDKDEALSSATKAYLDNYEYIERAVSQKDDSLMEKVEHAIRDDLRSMIKNGDSQENINAKILSIKTDLEKIELLFN